MRKESLLFSASVLATIFIVGIHGTVGLFIFGALWLIIGD